MEAPSCWTTLLLIGLGQKTRWAMRWQPCLGQPWSAAAARS